MSLQSLDPSEVHAVTMLVDPSHIRTQRLSTYPFLVNTHGNSPANGIRNQLRPSSSFGTRPPRRLT